MTQAQNVQQLSLIQNEEEVQVEMQANKNYNWIKQPPLKVLKRQYLWIQKDYFHQNPRQKNNR